MSFFRRLFSRETLAERGSRVLRETGHLPRDLRLDIVGTYGRVMQDMRGEFASVEDLPASKGVIEEALLGELREDVALTEDTRNSLESAYVLLPSFLEPNDLKKVRDYENGLELVAHAFREGRKDVTFPTEGLGDEVLYIRKRAFEQTKERSRELRKLFGPKPIRLGEILAAEVDFLGLDSWVAGTLLRWAKSAPKPGETDLGAELLAVEYALIDTAAHLMRLGEGRQHQPNVLLYALMQDRFPTTVACPRFGEAFDIYNPGVSDALPDVDALIQFIGATFARRCGLTANDSEFVGGVVNEAISRLDTRLETFQDYKKLYTITD